MRQNGFTLIELLISIILIVVVATVTVSTVTTSLRSASKTTLSGTIRQSGNYVVEQVIDFIRYGTGFKGVKVQPSDSYTTDCSTPAAQATQYHYVSIVTSTNDPLEFYCDSTPNATSLNMPPIASNGASLIDASSVYVTSCNFTCSQTSSTSPPTIGISFELNQVGGGSFSENNVTLLFSDSAFMRNIAF